MLISGNSSVGRAQPCQGWGREFESRFPLQILKSPNRTVWAFLLFKTTNTLTTQDLIATEYCTGTMKLPTL